jgi:ADP-ribose pyrophosphatase
MSSGPKFEKRIAMRSKTRVFDGFFKIDEVRLSHQRYDGTMSSERTFLVFERGDAVACLLFDREKWEVILVEQLKVPTIDKSPSRGYFLETMAGMIRPGETPAQTVVRETLEETGYRIKDPEHIATFFSSPGGSSERIFLYYAVVTDADRVTTGGGNVQEGEDILTVRMPAEALFERLRRAELEDPKLVIAAYHLRDRLKIEPPKSVIETPGTITFRKGNSGPIIGIKTGNILSVKDVDIWVNSENTDMMMDRVIGKTVSAAIRYGGAEKDESGNVEEDTIARALKDKLGRRSFVKIGTIVETVPGDLRRNGVTRVLHVASVEGKGPGGVRADLATVEDCVRKVLAYAIRRNAGFRIVGRRDQSILIPMIGAGDGGLKVEDVAERLFSAIDAFIRETPEGGLAEYYVLAYSTKDRAAAERALDRLGYARTS